MDWIFLRERGRPPRGTVDGHHLFPVWPRIFMQWKEYKDPACLHLCLEMINSLHYAGDSAQGSLWMEGPVPCRIDISVLRTLSYQFVSKKPYCVTQLSKDLHFLSDQVHVSWKTDLKWIICDKYNLCEAYMSIHQAVASKPMIQG